MDEMNTGEELVKQTEEKMVYKILYMIEQSLEKGENLSEVKEKIEALLKN